MTWRGSIERRYRPLLALVAPVVTLLLRVPLLLSRDGPFGFDPYMHLYFVRAWTRLGRWPVLGGGEEVFPHDYDSWPGAHILAASVSKFGAAPIDVLTYAPLVLLFAMDLVVVLLLLRRTDLVIATVGGVLFGLLDFLFFQTQWYIPELVGLLLITTLVLNELVLRNHLVSLLLLLAALVTHHLSFFIAVVFWCVLGSVRPRWARISIATIVAVTTYLFWDQALEHTGSFPDIQNQLGGVHPALVVIAAMVGLMGLRWLLTRLAPKWMSLPEGGTFLHILGEGRRDQLRWLAWGAVIVVVVVTLVLYQPSLGRADGIGIQPSKLLMLAGGVLFMTQVPLDRDLLRAFSVFGLVMLLFMLNPVLFDFIPLDIRFLEFMYIPGVLLLATGAFHLVRRRPERARAVLLALVLACPVLAVDDALRYESPESQRFAYSSEDLDFARDVGEATEEDAVVVTPFGLAPLVFGISQRRTATHPVRAALDGNGYGDALPYLEELASDHPVYLVQCDDPLRYMETEDDDVTREDVLELMVSIHVLAGRVELVLVDGASRMWRFT